MSGEIMANSGGQGKDESAASRMGIIEINDLVYKLESDLSVAINRTHKNNFFQQTFYDQTQTSVCILNSGADYIDTRRSFLSVSVLLPVTTVTTNLLDPMSKAFLSAYFGPTGSILNFIDNVVVTTRSGDELSRVNDFGQLMNTYIPWTFGYDWSRTVGQSIGLGGFLGGFNNNFVSTGNPNATSNRYQVTFNIPLYLLSPFFTYGRLLPSMAMSGLKIEIRWKQIGVAVQQFWDNVYLYQQVGSLTGPIAAPNSQYAAPVQFEGSIQNNMTQDRAYLGGGWVNAPTLYGLDSTITATTAFGMLDHGDGTYDFCIEPGHNPWNGTLPFNQETGPAGNDNWYAQRLPFLPGIDQIGFSWSRSPARGYTDNTLVELIFDVIGVVNPQVLAVVPVSAGNFRATTPASDFFIGVSPSTGGNVGVIPVNPQVPAAPPTAGFNGNVFRQSKIPFANRPQHGFNAPVERWKSITGSQPLASYQISNPFLQLCSVQLTDSIQRHLNEYSATNGLEIVFADWDRTTQALSGQVTTVYTEVRKSASRALQAFSVVVPTPGSTSFENNSFQSIFGGYWQDYQWQLGSLYFPQQRVESKGTSNNIVIRDNMYVQTYAFALDAWDRFHPKAAPNLMSLRGDQFPFNKSAQYVIPQLLETRDDNSILVPQSNYGQSGSFANGSQCVAVTLERSTMFDLSGIPINNSRVLALRGTYVIPDGTNSALQYVFLKYIRLARVFLINVEVEQ